MKQQVSRLMEETRKQAGEFDAIISVAGGFGVSSVKDLDIMDKYEE